MSEIEGNDKLNISRTLKNCDDIELFEQEAIKHIIDYKWNTFAKKFFLAKFIIYALFVFAYYVDLESIHHGDENGHRVKGIQFIVCKSIGFIIQFGFFVYELM